MLFSLSESPDEDTSVTETAKTSAERRPYSFGLLYDLLVHHFPTFRTAQGVFDIPRLARDLSASHETFYRAVRTDKMTVKFALKLIHLSRNTDGARELRRDHLLDFVFPPDRRRVSPARPNHRV